MDLSYGSLNQFQGIADGVTVVRPSTWVDKQSAGVTMAMDKLDELTFVVGLPAHTVPAPAGSLGSHELF